MLDLAKEKQESAVKKETLSQVLQKKRDEITDLNSKLEIAQSELKKKSEAIGKDVDQKNLLDSRLK